MITLILSMPLPPQPFHILKILENQLSQGRAREAEDVQRKVLAAGQQVGLGGEQAGQGLLQEVVEPEGLQTSVGSGSDVAW